MEFALEQTRLISASEPPTPWYATPEIHEFEGVDDIHDPGFALRVQQGDSYTFGVIAYEILTGRPVFATGFSATEVKRRSATRERPGIPPNINKRFAGIIERCWDCDRTKRPTLPEIWNVLDTLDFALVVGIDPVVMRNRVLALG
jgi:hypothetical protein